MSKHATISEDSIRDLVHQFYAQVREDDLIGPIFQARIKDWDTHLAKMVDFWSGVMLKTTRYEGRPFPAHAQISEIRKTHFARWLDLFQTTAHSVFEETPAHEFIKRSHMIADNFQHLLFTVLGREDTEAAPQD
ncbi:MAG: preprotein translocase subunit TatC [Kordiimonas sp.]|nr:preprotein translocase subunit TatC [Kordiimonas sp.]